MNFKEELEARAASAERIILKYLPTEEGYQKTVIEAMNYSILAGGKRLRPILMQETYRLFGGNEETVEPFMAALEMVHTYSLVHDDLPCMDNDEYRRGKKTTHAVYGEGMAVLAGDGLLNYAFETAVKAFGKAGKDEFGRVAKALAVFAEKAGIYGMIGGQTADIEAEERDAGQTGPADAGFGNAGQDGLADAESGNAGQDGLAGAESGNAGQDGLADAESGNAGQIGLADIGSGNVGQAGSADAEPGAQGTEIAGLMGTEAGKKMPGGKVPEEKRLEPVTEELLLFIHGHKTAALIQSAMMIGAILAGAEDWEVRRIEECARCIGVAFQIQDDILDVTGSLEVLGKAAGSDEKNHKTTYVTLKGIEQAKAEVVRLSEEAVSIAGSFSRRNAFLEELVGYLAGRDK